MNDLLAIPMITFGVTWVLLIPWIGFLYRKKFTRKEEKGLVMAGNETEAFKKVHALHSLKAGTPTGGGILLAGVILTGFALGIWWLRPQASGIFAGHDLRWEVGIIITAFLSFGLLGLYDDFLKISEAGQLGKFVGLRMRYKFLIQWTIGFVVAGMLYFGLGITFVNVPFWGVVNMGWWYLPIAAFLIVAFANAFDITCGLDGLGEGLLMICLLAFWVIAATQLDKVISLLISVWVGALLAGIYFTIYPARVWLGNASGLAFGATLAVVGLLSGKIVALLVIGGVFVVDGGSSLVQILSRKILKRRVFPIAPIHHWLEVRGWEEPKIVARAWLAGLMMAIFGVWLALL